MCVCACVCKHIRVLPCVAIYNQYNYNKIHFCKRITKPIVVELESPTKTNLNANTNVNVNILANALVCTEQTVLVTLSLKA